MGDEGETVTLVPELEDLDNIAESTGGRKVFRIVLEFELGGTKNHSGRLKEAYITAVTAAAEAVRSVLLNSNAARLTSKMTYEYRHLEGAEVQWELVSDHSEL